MSETGKERRERPGEIAKRLGIQLYKPVYTRGKGVGMSQVDDGGSYIDVGELPRALAKARKEGREEVREAELEDARALADGLEEAHETAEKRIASAKADGKRELARELLTDKALKAASDAHVMTEIGGGKMLAALRAALDSLTKEGDSNA